MSTTAPPWMSGLDASLRVAIRAVLAEVQADPDPWVPVDEHVRSWSRREAADRCRAGDVPGARRVGKRWIAKRSMIDAAIFALHDATPRETVPKRAAVVAPRGAPEVDDDAAKEAAILARWGERVVSPPMAPVSGTRRR